MSKRINRADRAVLDGLVDKYSPQTVSKYALARRSKKPGRPPDNPGNLAVIWGHVELRRAQNKRASVLTAARQAAKTMAKHFVGKTHTVSAIRAMHARAEALRAENDGFRKFSDMCLQTLRDALARGGAGAVVIPVLLKPAPQK